MSEPTTADADLERWDREHYWHAFTQMAEYQPLIVVRADGLWLETLDGRKLIDGASSLWCNIHGHRHAAIDQAIKSQLDSVAHVTSLGMSNPASIQLAQRLVEGAPEGLEAVFYSCDGSSAVEAALKMAFQYWRQCSAPDRGKDLFLALGNAYHGDTVGSVSVGGVSRFHAMFDPLLFEVARGPCPDSYRRPPGLEDASESDLCSYYLHEYRQLFERFGTRLAAVIVEPLMQCAAGMIRHPTGFLRGIRELADEFGTLLIADEIAVGVGRTGAFWASEKEGVAPDILCTGKGLSGGYLPLAATLVHRKIWDAFLGEYADSRSFFHGHTFGGNPLACAAGLANLDVFEQEQTLAHVNAMAPTLQSELRETLQDHPHVGDIRGIGMMAAVELVQQKEGQVAFPWAERMGYRVCEAALSKHVWLRPIGNVVIVMPPLSTDERHLRQICEAVRVGVHTTFGR